MATAKKPAAAARKPAASEKAAATNPRALAVGQPAPDFTLPDQDDRPVSLASLKGRWVVLYFYPRDDTPGCTVEACDFTSGLAGFEGLKATVLGCSADSTASHRKFIAKHGLKISLLSDPGKETMTRYGAWGEKTLYGKVTTGVIRSTVIIDPAGRVAHHYTTVKAAGHARAVQEKLTQLQSS
jgi:peroxiredoxin Q/BCP